MSMLMSMYWWIYNIFKQKKKKRFEKSPKNRRNDTWRISCYKNLYTHNSLPFCSENQQADRPTIWIKMCHISNFSFIYIIHIPMCNTKPILSRSEFSLFDGIFIIHSLCEYCRDCVRRRISEFRNPNDKKNKKLKRNEKKS